MPTADDARVVAELFDAHHARVLAYALRRAATEADAEEAASETFAVAWRRIRDAPDDALPWLYAIARRVIANQRRSGLRRIALHLRLTNVDAPAPERIGEEQGPATLALGRLPAADQELLRLVAWEELSHRQIAQTLGISENAVAIRLHRARRRLAESLADDDRMKGSAMSRTSGEAKGISPGDRQEDRG
jgi:RNA polymerase sigma-70 factor (ECF subfamily)